MKKTMAFNSLATGFICVLLFFSSTAEASYARLIEQLQLCEQETRTVVRLQCFDNIVAALPEPVSVAATPVAEKAVAEHEESEAFLTITEMWEYKRGFWKFRLANGEVWRQSESNTSFPFDKNRHYYFQKGMFDAYYLRTPGLNTRLRVKLEP